MTVTDDLVDRLVGGRYRVRERLGVGGMGAVYVALDTQDADREIALKLIKDTLVDSAEAAARFDREAAAMRHFEHVNIVRFLDAGVDGGLRYIAMERLVGRTLKERVAARGSMPWRDTLPILRGITSALEAAHARGLIHRDLKPENVMLVDGVESNTFIVKLLDFGVAKHTQLPDGMTMTGTGIIVGTPGFVAPEVVMYGSTDDPRSDFYGLGATWFEMLTGTKPFEAATPFALAMRHVSERPPRPTDLRPFDPVPIPVEALLFRLLAKSAGERPATARALLEELDALESAVSRSVDVTASTMPTMTDMRTPRPTGMMVVGMPGVTSLGASGPTQPTPSMSMAGAGRADVASSALSRVVLAAAVVAIVVAVVVVLSSRVHSTTTTPGTGAPTIAVDALDDIPAVTPPATPPIASPPVPPLPPEPPVAREPPVPPAAPKPPKVRTRVEKKDPKPDLLDIPTTKKP